MRNNVATRWAVWKLDSLKVGQFESLIIISISEAQTAKPRALGASYKLLNLWGYNGFINDGELCRGIETMGVKLNLNFTRKILTTTRFP